MINAYNILVGKPKRKEAQVPKSRLRWEDNNITDQEVRFGDANWINLAQNMLQY
jgi:hypothetical protein